MKGTRKSTKTTQAKKPKTGKAEPPEIEKEEDGKPDFGGLPVRDLKKNLGCG